jgi:hypothetical protein
MISEINDRTIDYCFFEGKLSILLIMEGTFVVSGETGRGTRRLHKPQPPSGLQDSINPHN